MCNASYSVSVPEDTDMCKICTLPTVSPLCVKNVHVDALGGVWMETVDGTRVVIPAEWRKLVAKWVREGTYR